VVFQNVSSSGFHSEIQLGFCLLIKDFLSERRRGHRGIAREGTEARSGEAPVWRFTIRMIGFDGRHQWRQHKLFKLCAKPPQREKY
jgi:hypothetical protein